jgi:hypothetical protein
MNGRGLGRKVLACDLSSGRGGGGWANSHKSCQVSRAEDQGSNPLRLDRCLDSVCAVFVNNYNINLNALAVMAEGSERQQSDVTRKATGPSCPVAFR